MRNPQKNKLMVLAALVISPAAYGAPVVPQSSGSILQQIPESHKASQALPEIRIQEGEAPAVTVSETDKVDVKRLQYSQLTGLKVHTEAELDAISGFKPGKYTLSELRKMTDRITAFYRKKGYFVAHAILPAQKITDGVVHVAVLKGVYDKVSIKNSTNLSDNLARYLLGGLDKGTPITVVPLEERLLLLSDIPGIQVSSTLMPGTSVGTSDLVVETAPGKRITGSIDADNEGNRYTGTNRIGATVNINDPAGHGDLASLRMLTSASGLNYGRAAYQFEVGRAHVGMAYASMQYWLGGDFANLNAYGTAKIVSAYGNYPVIRSRNNNLNFLVDHDSKSFQDNTTSTADGKHADVWMTTLSGDFNDVFKGGGVSNYSLTWTSGELSIGNAQVLATDATTANTNGHFDKLGFSASRVQRVTGTVSLYAAIHGQRASRNLDVSEKMELGGSGGVRAYPEGEAYSDEGYVLNIEARKTLPKLFEKQSGQVQLIGFVDTGTAALNKNPWAAGQNTRTLSGAGVGLTFVGGPSMTVQTYLAHKLGDASATSAPDSSNRFWVSLVKYF